MPFSEKPAVSELEKALPGNSTPTSKYSGGIEDPEWSIEEEKRIRNKLDWNIVPLITLLYLLCFLDRANIGNARIQGMQVDLDLYGYRFNWALTIFYIPYLLVEIPSNIILKKVGAKIYLPVIVIGFGLCSLCCAFVTDYKQLFGCRALLGMFEGGTLPGIAYYLSNFYRRKELMFRVGVFVSACSLSGAFGGLLATGLSRIPEWGLAASRIHTWRNIFFFEGLATMVLALASYSYLFNTPNDCIFLTPRERFISMERIRRDNQEDAAEKTKRKHIKRGILNINNIICALGFFFINVSAQSFSLFIPTILLAMGWTSTKAQLLTVPPYIVASIWCIVVCFLSDKVNKRGYFAIGNALCCGMGYAILVAAHSSNIKYMATFFCALGVYPLGPTFLSWGLINAAGPSVRAVSSGYIMSIASFGSILATWTYLPTDGPDYIKGHSINLGCGFSAAVVSVIGIVYIRNENKKRNAGDRDHRLEGLSDEERRGLGYRHPEFRYME